MNLLVGGLNLPFESPPHELTQLSYALAAVDGGCAMVHFGLHALSTPVLYNEMLLIVLSSVPLLQRLQIPSAV